MTRRSSSQSGRVQLADPIPGNVQLPCGSHSVRHRLDNDEHISGLCVRAFNHPGREFQNGMREETDRDTPRSDCGANLAHTPFAIDVYKVDRKLHAEGVDRFTRNYPESLALREIIAPQQTLSSRCARIGDFGGISE
jgi:hypothetical protein